MSKIIQEWLRWAARRADYYLDTHGPKIGAACCALSAVFVLSAMVAMFTVALPDYINMVETRSAELTAGYEVQQ